MQKKFAEIVEFALHVYTYISLIFVEYFLSGNCQTIAILDSQCYRLYPWKKVKNNPVQTKSISYLLGGISSAVVVASVNKIDMLCQSGVDIFPGYISNLI